MALGRQQHVVQGRLCIRPDELPRSQGHVFYDLLQKILLEHKFDSFAENLCEPFYAYGRGRLSIPPGRYFRISLLKKSKFAGRSKSARCKETKKSRHRGVLDIHKMSGLFR